MTAVPYRMYLSLLAGLVVSGAAGMWVGLGAMLLTDCVLMIAGWKWGRGDA